MDGKGIFGILGIIVTAAVLLTFIPAALGGSTEEITWIGGASVPLENRDGGYVFGNLTGSGSGTLNNCSGYINTRLLDEGATVTVTNPNHLFIWVQRGGSEIPFTVDLSDLAEDDDGVLFTVYVVEDGIEFVNVIYPAWW